MESNMAIFGQDYKFFVHSEPVAKTTQRPPKARPGNVRWIVMNTEKYKRLARTWQYQELVAQCAMVARIPHFSEMDPICLMIEINKSGHKTGDTKNIIASVEDGLVYGGFMPDDRQVTSLFGTVSYENGADKAGVLVTLKIDERALNLEWLQGYFGFGKAVHAENYYNDIILSTL
jgi:hypothetical protein